ncbi:endo-1,3;1,4-beta-D-glucanase-like [Andrographis paniculata]|uniref:endo-1,3;1,4-beta-D-glucanase-like n=1 Tax=Andrographis paniculata TaxID=175694 RepID=UPI0021E867EB|nr:endo-1,3;1,4-beta-D-glucanase-like [Andrographis paniculata]
MLGRHCTENRPPLSSDTRSGDQLQQIGALNAYVSGERNSSLAVLLISDIYGFEAPKLRKLADKVASSGFLVVVPDFFNGDPFKEENNMQEWISNHKPGNSIEDAKNVIAELRSGGVLKLGAAGFCWGGILVVSLAKFDCIQAAVLLHPGPISVEKINEVTTPMAILGAEFDEYSPPELLIQLGEVLSANQIDNYVKIYPGVKHGWTTRYDDNDKFAVQSAEEAHSDKLKWFIKYLK